MKGYNAKSKFGREGMGEESSFINRLNNLGHIFLDEDTTEHYISEALLLHVERFFCEQVRILNKWGGGGDITCTRKAHFTRPYLLFTLLNHNSRKPI